MKLIRTFLLMLLCVTFGQVAMAQQSNMQTNPKPKPKPVKMQPKNSSKPTKAGATTTTNAVKAETTPVTEIAPATETVPAVTPTPAPTSGKISQIQEALRAKGYDPGPTDNVLGAKTREALMQFQKDNNLPVGNLNVETMRALGVN